MANYRGYFKGFDRPNSLNPNGDLYCVHLGEFSANTYTELQMADTPFVVNYNTSSTPFDPVRTSTATIRIFNSGYTVDLFPTEAQEIPVVLYNETKLRVEWCGFVTPKVYDGDYVNCLDEISIEAADCISSLQYIDYTPTYDSSGRSIVVLNKLLGNICDGAGILERVYWTYSKTVGYNHQSPSGRNGLSPESLYLSEQNFYSSDTDEPWKMSEVLEEICRYFGFTCMQHGSSMYLIDFLAYKTRDNLLTNVYYKSSNYEGESYRGTETLTGGQLSMDADAFRAADASISLEPIYNKCVVKSNMYACERIMPAIMADDNLVNRLDSGNFFTNIELTVPNPKTPSYPYGSSWLFWQNYRDDYDHSDNNSDLNPNNTADTKYSYFMRVYDNTKGWTSLYNGSQELKPTTQSALTSLPGGTIVDLGVVRNEYDEYGQKIVPSKLDYTRYLMVNQQNLGGFGVFPQDYPVFEYKFKNNLCPFDQSDAYIVIQGSELNTKYLDRCYINPSWETNALNIATYDIYHWNDTDLVFLLKVGNYYWTGRGWSTTRTVFRVDLKNTGSHWNGENLGESNTERKILNNVSYNLEVGEEGYLIPLSGLGSFSLASEILFQVHMPTCQYQINGEEVFNGFVWIKDLDIKLVQKGQDSDNNEGDVVYENVINTDAVNELSDITCKITSYFSGVAPSYSTAMYYDYNQGRIIPLSGFCDSAASEARSGEENIIEKYVQEYQHQTRKITYTVDNHMWGLRPWSRFTLYDPEEPAQMYVVLGEEIDYQNGTDRITAIELK